MALGLSPRARWALAMIVLGGGASLLALTLLYARAAVFDAQGFSDRTVTAVQQEPVREYLAAELTTQVVEGADADLIGVRPVVQSAIGGVLAGSAFESVFRAAVDDLHRNVFSIDQDTFTLRLSDALILASGLLESTPRAAGELSTQAERGASGVVEVSQRDASVDLVALAALLADRREVDVADLRGEQPEADARHRERDAELRRGQVAVDRAQQSDAPPAIATSATCTIRFGATRCASLSRARP